MPVLSAPLKNRLAVISTSVTTTMEVTVVTQEAPSGDQKRIKKKLTSQPVTTPVELPEQTNIFAKGDLVKDECGHRWTITDINSNGTLEMRNGKTFQIKYRQNPAEYTHVRPKNQPHTFIHTELSTPKVPYASRRRGGARE